MKTVKFYKGETLPLEMHKVRIVQKLNLIPVEKRLVAMKEAGFNTFLLKNRDVFLDMLTDSGVNAMSDIQQASMLTADDSYAGSETFYRLEAKLHDLFGMKYFLPTHQGRACEHILAKIFVKSGDVVPMNYHFTTTKAHITICGGEVLEIYGDDALIINSDKPFKGDIDIKKLEKIIKEYTSKRISFVRIEAGTNLIGGQPVSMKNMKDVCALCKKNGILTVFDASLLSDNLYFIKIREKEYFNASIREITKEMASLYDIIYFSARKLGSARGGGICLNSDSIYLKMREMIPLFEGFLTYGGMSVREMEAMTVGLEETMDFDMISQGPLFIDYMAKELIKRGVPVVTPGGGLGCHLDANQFIDHVPFDQYRSGALVSALYIISGVRGMERGTLSEARKPDGSETIALMELVRLALPRRVFTLSQVMYAVDRIAWLYENRKIIGGLIFTDEPKILRFFFGILKPVSDWPDQLVKKFREDFKDSL